jgi:hypothetical protein
MQYEEDKKLWCDAVQKNDCDKNTLLRYRVQILGRNEQAHWESELTPFMVMLVSWILHRFRRNLL